MSFFSECFERTVRASSQDYYNIKTLATSHFVSKSTSLGVGKVVSIEPVEEIERNQQLRAQGLESPVECEYALITSEKNVNGLKVFGFVSLNCAPKPLIRLIDAMHDREKRKDARLRELGQDPVLIGLGLEQKELV